MELNVYNDCWGLVQQFHRLSEELQHSQFDLFCRCWQDLQMQHIYSALTNHIEVIATTLSAMHVAKRVASSRRPNGQAFPASRAHRFAGIYLLYVIYNKQPTQHFVRIELSSSTWDTLISYIIELQTRQSPRKDTQQVCHIFWNLCQHNAFRFTASDYGLGLDNLISYDHLESIVGSKGVEKHHDNVTKLAIKQQMRPAQASLYEDLNAFSDLERVAGPLCQLESAYNKQKYDLAKRDNGALSPTHIFSQLQETFNEVRQLLGGNAEQPSSSTTSLPICHGELRKQVRHKAMYGNEETKIHSQVESLDDGDSSLPTSVQRRMSSATIFVRQLPMEVAKEYQRGCDSEEELH